MLRQRFAIDARPVIETFRIAQRHQLQQIAITGQIPRQQDHVMVGLAAPCAAAAAAESGTGGHIGLDPDDRFHAGLAGQTIELQRPEKIAMVGDGHRRLAVIPGCVHQFLQAAGSIQQRVLRVIMEMNK